MSDVGVEGIKRLRYETARPSSARDSKLRHENVIRDAISGRTASFSFFKRLWQMSSTNDKVKPSSV